MSPYGGIRVWVGCSCIGSGSSSGSGHGIYSCVLVCIVCARTPDARAKSRQLVSVSET